MRPYYQDIPPIDYTLPVQNSKPVLVEQAPLDAPKKGRWRFSIKWKRKNRSADASSKPPQKPSVIARAKKTRGSRALSDAIISFGLDGYVELTGAKLAPSSGQIVLFFIELIGVLDEYLDKYVFSRTPPTMNEVLKMPEIIEQIAEFYRHVELSGYAIPILKHLRCSFTTYYNTYVNALIIAKDSLIFEDVLEVAKIDTGISCRIEMEIVCLYNEHQIDDEILNDYYLFGLVAKFADDMIDLSSDAEKGVPNLLYALMRQNSEEYALLQSAIKQGKRINIAWCKKYCPRTVESYFGHIERYYQQIKSSRLRRLSILMFAGYNHTFGAPTLVGGGIG